MLMLIYNPTDNLELAALPTTTPEERTRLLSFVVCGGGPTGVEFAAELVDMMAEDVLKYVGSAHRASLNVCERVEQAYDNSLMPMMQYPKLLGSEVKVHVIQSRDHILNTYSEKISEYAESKFARNDVKLWTNARYVRIWHRSFNSKIYFE